MHEAWRGDGVSDLRTLATSLRGMSAPPWLRDATDPATLTEALRERIGRVVPGAADLTGVRVRDVRARRSWSLRLDADVVTGDEQRAVTLLAQLPLPGSAVVAPHPGAVDVPSLGMTVRLAEREDGLPTVRTLSSPGPARALLQSALAGGRASPRLDRVRSRLVRDKPGRRATLVCDLVWDRGADPSVPRRIVAKVYRDDSGSSTHAWMSALWDGPLRHSERPRLAEPLGYLADERTLLQRGLPGETTLADLLADRTPDAPPVPAALREAGAGLAALHGCGVTTGPRRTAGSELTTADELLARLAPTFPDREAEVRELLGTLGRFLGEDPRGPVPVHGAFRPAQVLLDGLRPGFLDFDGFGQGEPALDVGRFLARLQELGRDRPDRLALAGEFLDGYRTAGPLALDRVGRWLVLDLALAAVRSWYRGGFERAAVLLDLATEALDSSW